MPMQLQRSSILWALSILAALGPLWLVPRDIWDGTIGDFALTTGDFSGFVGWLHDSNWFLLDALYRLIHQFSVLTGVPHWVLVKTVICISLILIAREAMLFGRDVLRLPVPVNQWLGPLVLVFPAWANLYSSVFIYIVFIGAGLAGHRLIHADKMSGISWRQVVGMVLLALSFQVNSNFTLLLGLECVRWLWRDRQLPWNWKRSLALLLACVLAYSWLRLYFPPRGAYAGYNNLLLPISKSNVLGLLTAAAMFSTWVPLIAWPVALVFLLTRTRQTSVAWTPAAWTDARMKIWAGLLLVGAAVLPYVAVGKAPVLFFYNPFPFTIPSKSPISFLNSKEFLYLGDSWSTRHFFVTVFPLSLLICALVHRFTVRISQTTESAVYRRNTGIVLGLTWLLLSMGLIHTHGLKLRRMAAEQSFFNYLKTAPPPPAGLVDFQVLPENRWLYPTNESNFWLWQAYGKDVWASVAFYPGTASEDLLQKQRSDVLAEQGKGNPTVLSHNLMSHFKATGVCTTYKVQMKSAPGLWTLMSFGHRPDTMPPADVRQTSGQCQTTG